MSRPVAVLRVRVLAPLAGLLAGYGGLVLFAITALTMVNVGGFALDALVRPLGGAVAGLSGYEEVVALLIGGTLSFLPWCQLRRGHVSVDLFTRFMPAGLVRVIDRFSLLLTAALAFGLALAMAAGMGQARADGIVTGVRGLPEWPFWLPGIVSLAVWGVTAAVMALDPSEDDPLEHGSLPHG